MKKWTIFLGILMMGLTVLFSTDLRAEDMTNAQVSAITDKIESLSQKVDGATAKQDQILKELEDLKAELEIVKVRVSLKN